MKTLGCTLILLAALSLNGAQEGRSGSASEGPGPVSAEASSRGIREDRFVAIGGIEQWVTIRGDDRANPIVLFLHGGPGNTLTPFADAIYGGWEAEFTLVQWDQRGAGRTWGRNPSTEESVLTIQRMTDDGILLVEYILDHLGKEKLILTGSSWGSALAVHMIHARPDLFEAYVGVSQLVSKAANQAASYAAVLAVAHENEDESVLVTLGEIGEPPWRNPRHFGVLRRVTRAYERKKTIPAPSSWWIRSPEYATEEMKSDYEAGEDFSFLQFVGFADDGMFTKVDLPAIGAKFTVPIYLIQGEEDLVTVPEITKKYFESLEAPAKRIIMVSKAGHDPNAALIEAQYEMLRGIRQGPASLGRVE